VLGYDTAVRLVMPKYYGGHDGMLLQLAGMSHLGCHVVVAGRIATDDQGESSFMTFEDVEVPDAITDLVRVSFTHLLHPFIALCDKCPHHDSQAPAKACARCELKRIFTPFQSLKASLGLHYQTRHLLSCA